jgi:hypothetical protein
MHIFIMNTRVNDYVLGLNTLYDQYGQDYWRYFNCSLGNCLSYNDEKFLKNFFDKQDVSPDISREKKYLASSTRRMIAFHNHAIAEDVPFLQQLLVCARDDQSLSKFYESHKHRFTDFHLDIALKEAIKFQQHNNIKYLKTKGAKLHRQNASLHSIVVGQPNHAQVLRIKQYIIYICNLFKQYKENYWRHFDANFETCLIYADEEVLLNWIGTNRLFIMLNDIIIDPYVARNLSRIIRYHNIIVSYLSIFIDQMSNYAIMNNVVLMDDFYHNHQNRMIHDNPQFALSKAVEVDAAHIVAFLIQKKGISANFHSMLHGETEWAHAIELKHGYVLNALLKHNMQQHEAGGVDALTIPDRYGNTPYQLLFKAGIILTEHNLLSLLANQQFFNKRHPTHIDAAHIIVDWIARHKTTLLEVALRDALKKPLLTPLELAVLEQVTQKACQCIVQENDHDASVSSQDMIQQIIPNTKTALSKIDESSETMMFTASNEIMKKLAHYIEKKNIKKFLTCLNNNQWCLSKEHCNILLRQAASMDADSIVECLLNLKLTDPCSLDKKSHRNALQCAIEKKSINSILLLLSKGSKQQLMTYDANNQTFIEKLECSELSNVDYCRIVEAMRRYIDNNSIVLDLVLKNLYDNRHARKEPVVKRHEQSYTDKPLEGITLNHIIKELKMYIKNYDKEKFSTYVSLHSRSLSQLEYNQLLRYAAAFNALPILIFLLSDGVKADLYSVGQPSGKNALQYAIEQKRLESVLYLLRQGTMQQLVSADCDGKTFFDKLQSSTFPHADYCKIVEELHQHISTYNRDLQSRIQVLYDNRHTKETPRASDHHQGKIPPMVARK